MWYSCSSRDKAQMLPLILANDRGSCSVENYFKHIYAFLEEKRKNESKLNLCNRKNYYQVLWKIWEKIVLAVVLVQDKFCAIKQKFVIC